MTLQIYRQIERINIYHAAFADGKIKSSSRWREKATLYNSRPSRLQNNCQVYKAGVTSTIHK